MIILDTNVISALMRPELNEVVVAWSDRQHSSLLWTTSISLMEVRTGLWLMPQGARRQKLSDGFDRLLAELLLARILPFDAEAAEAASRIAATQQQRGVNSEIGDYQIAGIAISRNARVATRNVKDFSDLGIELANPWTD